jgi:hypothetical protein
MLNEVILCSNPILDVEEYCAKILQFQKDNLAENLIKRGTEQAKTLIKK